MQGTTDTEGGRIAMMTSGLGIVASPAFFAASGSAWALALILAVPVALATAALWTTSPRGRRLTVRVSRRRSTDIAVRIVTERYARGEIDLSEYQRLIVGLTT
jgi:uncharacterized membrane protein